MVVSIMISFIFFICLYLKRINYMHIVEVVLITVRLYKITLGLYKITLSSYKITLSLFN